MVSIEEFLGLNEDDIEKRMNDLQSRIPTKPGTEYLKTRVKAFDVQPWSFIRYLAYYQPELLEEGLSRYCDYDGAENYQTVMEQLREYYIMWKLIDRLKKE